MYIIIVHAYGSILSLCVRVLWDRVCIYSAAFVSISYCVRVLCDRVCIYSACIVGISFYVKSIVCIWCYPSIIGYDLLPSSNTHLAVLTEG